MELDKAIYAATHKALEGKGRTPPYVCLRGVTVFKHTDGSEEEQVYPEDVWPGEEVVLRVDPDLPDRAQQRWRVAQMVAEGFFVPKDEYDPSVHGGPFKTREEYDRAKEAEQYGGVDKAAFQSAVAAGVAQALKAYGIDPEDPPEPHKRRRRATRKEEEAVPADPPADPPP